MKIDTLSKIWIRYLSKVRKEYLILIGTTIILSAIGGYFIPDFLTIQHQTELFRRISIPGIMALGQTLVILTGGVDLSVGANMMTVAIIGGIFFASMGELWLPIILILLLGALIGLLNGLGIGLLKVPPIVMTLGMMTALSGFTLVYTGGYPRGGAHNDLVNFVSTNVMGMPAPGIIWAILTIILWFMLRKTKFGREVYAVGSNPISSYLSGIQIKKILVAVYIFAGLFTSISSLFYLGRIITPALSVAPAGIGLEYLLAALAIPVMGGTTFRGGEGGVIGTFIAAYLYGIIRGLLIALGFGEAGILIFTGIIIVGIIVARQKFGA
jgi:ribose transport system permease protein